MITLIAPLLFGILLGYLTWTTYNKMPPFIQSFLQKHPIVWDIGVSMSNLLFVTAISMSFLAIATAAVSEITALFLFRFSKKEKE